MTTPAQITAARRLAEDIAKLPRVVSAAVDDWGDGGGFNIFITVNHLVDGRQKSVRGLMHRVHALVRRIGEWEWCQAPKARYYRVEGRRYFDGWESHRYKLSVWIRDTTPESPKPEPEFACRADMPNP